MASIVDDKCVEKGSDVQRRHGEPLGNALQTNSPCERAAVNHPI